MKASQVIARIEAAGWKKLRQEGSHIVFEHPKFGRRSTAFGRPQRDVNKHRLVEVVNDFHLAEIEQAKIDARLAEAKRRPEPARVSLARVVPGPVVEMSDYDMRILWAQLQKEHNYTAQRLGLDLNLNSVDLFDFFHHGKALGVADRRALVAFLANSERHLKLTRNRAELLRKGYGARTGSSNAVDPFLAVIREALLKTLDAGIAASDLARTIGIGASTIYGIKSGKAKTIYPDAKAKLQSWYDNNWDETREVYVPPAKDEGRNVDDRIHTQEEAAAPSIDDELVAIQIVLNAVKPLGPNTAKRALRYVLDRMDG